MLNNLIHFNLSNTALSDADPVAIEYEESVFSFTAQNSLYSPLGFKKLSSTTSSLEAYFYKIVWMTLISPNT